MKKIVLIPDSFKGTMSSMEICELMSIAINRHYPDAVIVPIPVADGGEGSVECFLEALDGERIDVKAMNPFMEEMDSFYGIIDNGKSAVVEISACAGLPLIEDRKNPLHTTTYGVGQIMVDAAKNGVKKIIIGLGGSCTNDGGCGAACAAGIRFYNAAGDSFIPTGGTLIDIAKIDMSGYDTCFDDVQIIAMCDVDNPMYGRNGAANIFGPQKGATPEMVKLLDEGVIHLSKIIKRDLNLDLADVGGTGAAGAMGAGMIAFFGARLQMGIEVVLDMVGFEDVIKDADMIFTGEGKIDSQSLRGKVVIGVARRAKKLKIPVVAVVGDIGDNMECAYDEGVSAIFSINRVAVDFPIAKQRAKNDMMLTMDNLIMFCKHMGL